MKPILGDYRLSVPFVPFAVISHTAIGFCTYLLFVLAPVVLPFRVLTGLL